MDRGVIVQLGTGPEVYSRPATPFVADFLGRVNFLRGRVRGREGTATVVERDHATFRITDIAAPEGTALKIGIRPERMRMCDGTAWRQPVCAQRNDRKSNLRWQHCPLLRPLL